MPKKSPQANLKLDLDKLDDERIDAFGMLIEAHAEAARTVTATMSDGGTNQQFFGVLIRLGRTPGHAKRMTELAHDMTVSTSGLTRLVDRMESEGLIERQPCPEDRRGFLVALTTRGLRELTDVADLHLEAIDAAIGEHLDAEQITMLTDLLRIVRDGNRAR